MGILRTESLKVWLQYLLCTKNIADQQSGSSPSGTVGVIAANQCQPKQYTLANPPIVNKNTNPKVHNKKAFWCLSDSATELNAKKITEVSF